MIIFSSRLKCKTSNGVLDNIEFQNMGRIHDTGYDQASLMLIDVGLVTWHQK